MAPKSKKATLESSGEQVSDEGISLDSQEDANDAEAEGSMVEKQRLASLFIQLDAKKRGNLKNFSMLDAEYDFGGLYKMFQSWNVREAIGGGSGSSILPLNIILSIALNKWLTKGDVDSTAIALHPMGLQVNDLKGLPIYLAFRRWTKPELSKFRACTPVDQLRLTNLALPWHLHGDQSRDREVIGIRVISTSECNVDAGQWLRFRFNRNAASRRDLVLLLMPDCSTLLSNMQELLNASPLPSSSFSGKGLKKLVAGGPFLASKKERGIRQYSWFFLSSSSACKRFADQRRLPNSTMEAALMHEIEREWAAEGANTHSQRWSEVFDTLVPKT